MRFVLSLPIASLVLVAGCVPRAAPPPVEPPRPVPAPVRPAPTSPPAPPPSSDWRDWPLTAGDWRYASDARGSSATFGGGRFVFRCDRGGNAVYLTRAGEARGRGTGFVVRTSTTTRALPTQPAPGDTGAITAVLTPDDRLLDAIGFSRGRFVVEAPPLPTLVLPAWAEILRVVEDCRR